MFLKKRNIGLFFIILSAILFPLNFAYAQNSTRNVTVRVSKPEIILRYWIIDTSFDIKGVKCKVYKPPDMILWKKPKFGKVKIKKGVVVDNKLLRNDRRKNCKGKVIKSTTLEFTGNKKGKDSFKVEVLYPQGRYEEYSFETILFNVNVR